MQEKLKRLEKYASLLNGKLSDDLPVKHQGRPVSYKAFLIRELEMTRAKIDMLKLGKVSDKI